MVSLSFFWVAVLKTCWHFVELSHTFASSLFLCVILVASNWQHTDWVWQVMKLRIPFMLYLSHYLVVSIHPSSQVRKEQSPILFVLLVTIKYATILQSRSCSRVQNPPALLLMPQSQIADMAAFVCSYTFWIADTVIAETYCDGVQGLKEWRLDHATRYLGQETRFWAYEKIFLICAKLCQRDLLKST